MQSNNGTIMESFRYKTKLLAKCVRHSFKIHMNTETTKLEDDTEDYYSILGVHKTSTPHQIRRAYRRLAVKYHPDKTSQNEYSTEYFQKISKVYHILSDPDKRRIYDDYGEQGIRLMESCGQKVYFLCLYKNEKAFKIISKKWFIALMSVLGCLTCCCFGCFCCFFCCNFCCGKYSPGINGDNSDDEYEEKCHKTQNVTFDDTTINLEPSSDQTFDSNDGKYRIQ